MSDCECKAGSYPCDVERLAAIEADVAWIKKRLEKGDALMAKLEKIMTRSFADVLKIHTDKKVDMRLAANMLGVSRVAEASRVRGLYP